MQLHNTRHTTVSPERFIRVYARLPELAGCQLNDLVDFSGQTSFLTHNRV